MNTKKMHIVYASDDYYFTYIYVSVKTLIRHNSNLVIHYLYQNVSENHLQLLKQVTNVAGVETDFKPFEIPSYFKVLPTFGVASKTTYAKLIFPSIFPELDKVLYLDPDTIIMGNIKAFYDINMGDNLIAGVLENLPYYQRKVVGLSVEDAYINGGMVLCNLKKWREENIEEKAITRLQDVSMNLNYDQGILNELCAHRIMVVPPKYNALAEIFAFRSSKKISKRYHLKNFYSQDEINEAICNPIIIHFTHFV
ncbi:MAG: glycosyltransferase family 8 protein, partial [Intestinibacter sp.]